MHGDATDLLTAYSVHANARAGEGASGQAHGVVARRSASLAGAAGRHDRGQDWTCLDEYLLSYLVVAAATVFASSFAAALELVREGEVELNQKAVRADLCS